MPLVRRPRCGSRVRAGARRRPLRRAGALAASAACVLASRSLALGLRYLGPDFDFEPPRYEPVGAAVARRDRHRQADRQDGADGAARAPARPRPRRRRRRDGARRPRGARADRGGADARRPARAVPVGPTRGVRPPRDGRSAPACGRSAAGAAAAASPGRWRPRTSPRAPVSRRSSRPTSSSSTAAAPPFRRWPPTAAILVTSGAQDVRAGLNAYRVLVSDLVVAVGVDEAQAAAIREIEGRPGRPLRAPSRARRAARAGRVAVFTAGPASTDHLEADVVATSANLADRARLREDLASIDAETYVIEIKAAAIDVVAEAAQERGARVVFARNDVVSRARRARPRRSAARARRAAVAEAVPA